MDKIELKQVNGNIINLLNGLTDAEKLLVVDHFSTRKNHTDEIMHQINNDYYSQFFVNKKYNSVFDCGMNIGLFSIYIQPICDNIIGFEPTLSHFNIANILTKQYSNIKAYNLAINSYSGSVTFHTDNTNSTTNSMVGGGRGADYQVDCITIKDAVQKFVNPIETNQTFDFIKCDIEGGEKILLENNFNNHWVNAKEVFMETHGSFETGDIDTNRDKWCEKLKEIGYNINHLDIGLLFASLEK